MPSNIGIAFEDVISSDSDTWANFMKFTRLERHTIFILTEGPEYTTKDMLDYHGLYRQVHWDRVLSLFVWLTDNGYGIHYDEAQDRWRSDDPKLWYELKARLCFEQNISIMFEENPRHFAAFKRVPTRLVDLTNEFNHKMVLHTAERLKAVNSWFDDYEGCIPGD